VIVDIKNRESPTITATLPLMNSVIGPPTLAAAESSGDVTSFAWVMPSYSNNAIATAGASVSFTHWREERRTHIEFKANDSVRAPPQYYSLLGFTPSPCPRTGSS
jgi:hypothetical protein